MRNVACGRDSPWHCARAPFAAGSSSWDLAEMINHVKNGLIKISFFFKLTIKIKININLFESLMIKITLHYDYILVEIKLNFDYILVKIKLNFVYKKITIRLIND